MFKSEYVKKVYKNLEEKNPNEKEYLNAAKEILLSLEDYISSNKKFEEQKILERFLEPERGIEFKVVWTNDKGEIEVNKGYRYQFNSAIGPYKGGLRFHPSVNRSIIKFLGLEQVLKNSLTGLPMGGAKGGSDFDPKGKSDNEIKNFCQSFMSELYRHIGPNTDVPAGDIGVGAREIGYLFGQYKKIRNEFTGVLTGKGLSFGGSLIRPEATGYGLCYFASQALETYKNTSFKDKTVVISGSGNVAIYATEKVQELGGKVVALSDSNGYIYVKDGINLDIVKDIKLVKRGRIEDYLDYDKNAIYKKNCKDIWSIKCDIVLPCATQGELDLESAKLLVKNGCIAVCEGANMPTTLDAIDYLIKNEIIFTPGKASNAGGVATSGLEMSQNSIRLSWTKEEVDMRLKDIMINIFNNAYKTALKYGNKYDLVMGANIAGFEKVAEAMIAQGI